MSGPRKKPNSGKHVFLKNCSSGTDQRLLDADFDRYWDDESKNNNRNRIRVGRQYQATVPPLLKPGEADGRRCEDLETLKWKPDQEISDEQLDNYLSVVKAVSLFAKAINICQNPDSETGKCLQNALRGLSEFVTNHQPNELEPSHQGSPGGVNNQSSCSASSGVCAPAPSAVPSQNYKEPGWCSADTGLFLKALEVCGKNFTSIKKDFFPWKPVRNLIEYYYRSQKGEGQPEAQQPQPKCLVGNNGLRKDTAPTVSSPLRREPLPSQASTGEGDCSEEDEVVVLSESLYSGATAGSNSEGASGSVGAATLSLPSSSSTLAAEEGERSRGTFGSLKFYLDGQMVLKLNARQDSSGVCGNGPRCQWVQSKDKSCKLPHVGTRRKRRMHRVANGNHGQDSADRGSSASGAESSDNDWLRDMVKQRRRRTLVPCLTTVVSPKPAWTPPIDKGLKHISPSPLCEDTKGLRGS